MSARFEVVRTDAEQPWHGRLIINGRITWITEQHTRMVGVERAILSLLTAAGTPVRSLAWNVEGSEKVIFSARGVVLPDGPLVRYVDERTGATP